MSKIMTAGEYMSMIEKHIKEYHKNGVLASLKRSSHMSKYKGQKVSQDVIDAILVDVINYLGLKQCLDYGMYTKDLYQERKY